MAFSIGSGQQREILVLGRGRREIMSHSESGLTDKPTDDPNGRPGIEAVLVDPRRDTRAIR
jgi:hypothetical protein